MEYDYNIQDQEIEVLSSIFGENFYKVPTTQCDSLKFQIKILVKLVDDFKLLINSKDLMPSIKKDKEKEEEEKPDEYIEYKLVSLPPITLKFEFTDGYPESMPPKFELSSCWLKLNQMDMIVNYLETTLYQPGELVVFKCVDWIKDGMMKYLGIENQLIISGDLVLEKSSVDGRCYWETEQSWVSLLSAIPYIQYHNSLEMKRLFNMESTHLCPICYCDYPPEEMSLLKCNHFLCNGCLSQTCQVNIDSKDIKHLKCTEPGCPQDFDMNLIQKFTSPKHFEDYLLLQQQSKGYLKCDKCPNGWAFIDTRTQSTFCNKCLFSKCISCHQQFHPGIICDDVGKPPEEINRSLLSVSRSRQKLDMFKNVETKVLSTIMVSERIIHTQRIKKCPGCGIMIYKFDGCNKIKCTFCKVSSCYLCSKIIDSYSHFGNGKIVCQLFDDSKVVTEEVVLVPRIQTVLTYKTVETSNNTGTMKCVRCASTMYRYKNNNHLYCDRCKTQQCYQCKNVIQGTKHYTTTKCNQHGDDHV
ncbi:hypothetical protein DLAC_03623 [Tieghemostelium lacteum]|uniref:RBR-type E3 ubiquitin transferase n=1 Tax=Tieghemostelium lacteum TaxID=361077 RepID=A0A152A0D2_TIELA|nr:hypothetical protein DLAC_03623 [Tieghemostelium lacteum]|eukprot:KYQ99685.1 hypothetical protein DLAC_03623 [Tieghemostelium lacteum]